ncbi:DNA-directed RNA polymerase subunit beta [Candidatus Nomurabacteria bacterium]|nr:DNA-directed RNA polymerase subunit beta [Candidatus Nomurabacteria bacterium]USN94829.1 MAG: DNA-directed RNA polymerase subunit beta [Candidatus Nomurabacteria bacterium]
MSSKTKTPQKKFSKYREPFVNYPNLLEHQVDSYKWFIKEGIEEILKEFSPITDYSGKKYDLEFSDFTLSEPKTTEEFAKENKLTYEATLKARVKLLNRVIGNTKDQEIFMTDIPLMTPHGTFIVNGVERVIVPQLTRSFGVFFTDHDIKGKKYFGAKVIPSRGVWIEIEQEQDEAIYVRIDKKRKFPIISLLRTMGAESEKDLLALFDKKYHDQIKSMIEKDPSKTAIDACVEIYKKLRDGDLATPENAREYIDSIFSAERYDLAVVGRYQFNKRFKKDISPKTLENRTLTKEDMALVIEHVIELYNTPNAKGDDIDHLAQRRVRFVGELLQQKFRTGMTQIKRNIQDRMSTIDAATALPINIINQKPLQARIKEFFTTNQLSQFMDQENILAELEHSRIISALGPGGLAKERAGLEVRDVHTSHYGRVCPIHTPEGQNIGLVLHLATYARVNQYGIIETPYMKVEKGKVTGEIEYLNALEEEGMIVAHAGTKLDDNGKIVEPIIEARIKTSPGLIEREKVDYIDVATNQPLSIATSMIPFLEHNDANRALMGSNMQKQAVPCIVPEKPVVATGIEEAIARYSGRLVIAGEDGEIVEVDGNKITLKGKEKTTYKLSTFSRTNKFSLFHQRPIVSVGQKVKKGDVLADTSSTVDGQASIGQNVRVAFMSFNGSNYEDAIILSERLVQNAKFTSIYLDELTCVVRDTKLGPEVTTRDIPNVGENKLKDLDEEGVVRIGAEVREGDILVGKITPKGETELTPEERLLRSIFAEKARDVKDSSLRMPNGKRGRVISIKIFSRERGDQLESGVIKKIVIEVAQVRNISVGDKLAGRHGNKGVISTILPVEDMPYDENGDPVDAILTPLGIPSRMNLGQILEMHLGIAAETLGYQAIVPPFCGATVEEISDELEKAGFPRSGQIPLYDGKTGEKFDKDIAVGIMYILKLHHMVEDKIAMRSIGPYSLITQQPLQGKAQGGGQRFGEMEVWALEGYGASYTLREMLTYKSDDIVGRTQAFDSIIKGKNISQVNAPASFQVMLNYLRGLSLDVELQNETSKPVEETEN